MRYFKKLNKFNILVWVAKLEQCSDADAIEITEQEYNTLVKPAVFDELIVI